MSSKIPITLKGPNLGERHRYLNSLVAETYNTGEPIESILELPEHSSVDRLFKIDLASKHKHSEYILKNLQDEDMLYVSRALKSTWLLEEQYRHIVNPDHLEVVLYPHMIITAINKMKHWIHLNLNDHLRCHEFYKYYAERDSDYAFKFLCKCPEEIILSEFPKPATLEKITPQRLKVLCEKTSVVAKLFYEILNKNTPLATKYFEQNQEYFDKIKCILKTDADIFLDITEQHFLTHFKRLSAVSTKFIMTHRKNRFMQKPELYTARILNVSEVAQCLTPDECEDVVMKLARARYLDNEHWFSYQNVEPFFKRLDYTKRASFKQKVFVNKDVGETITEWPYAVPRDFNRLFEDDDVKGVFLEPEGYENYDYFGEYSDMESDVQLCAAHDDTYGCIPKRKSYLDALFEEYRFSNFHKTMFELRKKLKSESSSQNRMNMFLVLVSKSGGRPENVDALFNLLMNYNNEPCQVRAAVIRSLVKRVSIWRVSEDIWKNLLIFGRGLGFDGNDPEADCLEGLHAVMIRTLLSNSYCEPAIKAAFLKCFSTFSDYSLTIAEKKHIKESLLKMLVESANAEIDAKTGAKILEYAIDTFEAYKIKVVDPEFTATIKKLVRNDPITVKCLLERLFRSKLGRKELYIENFDFVQTDASYINALKHDVTILSVDKFIKSVVSDGLKAEQFLRKISIYFSNGDKDLTDRFLKAIKETKLHKYLARPITYLSGYDLKSYMLELDLKDEDHKRFSALLRANAHVARPAFNLNLIEWQKAGAKLIANRVSVCKAVDIDSFIKKLLTWNKTARLAIILAHRTNYEADIFATVAIMRPIKALKSALTYFRRQGDQSDFRIWEIVKPLIVRVKANQHLVNNIRNTDSIPSSILPEYLTETFKVISEIDFNKSLGLLFRIKTNLLKIDENVIEVILKNFVQQRLVLDKIPKDSFDYEYDKIAELHLSIFGRYLLLCKNEDIQNKRLKDVGQLYFDRLKMFSESKEMKNRLIRYLTTISKSFKYTEMFLNDEYVSCLPVMEKFVDWMRDIFPVEKYFLAYVPFHLNMLYYKTIRQAVAQIPGPLDNKQKRQKGYEIVGETFGRYVSKEARVLANNYFGSIVFLYQVGLTNFFDSFNEERYRMAPYIIKGIIDASDGIECTLALTMYENIYHVLNEHEKVKILNCFRQKNIVEMQFGFNNWAETNRDYDWAFDYE